MKGGKKTVCSLVLPAVPVLIARVEAMPPRPGSHNPYPNLLGVNHVGVFEPDGEGDGQLGSEGVERGQCARSKQNGPDLKVRWKKGEERKGRGSIISRY
jgi:hypothetical protein